jgi:hypothetical protein
MADNIQLSTNVGVGDVLAADDVGGTKYPIGKVAFGALDTATLVTATEGLPVQGEGMAGTPGGGVLTIQGAALMTAVLTDGSATTQPVSLASVPSHAVTNAGTFATQATLQAGTAEIGKLAAGLANIGDVDVATIAAGDNNIGNVDIVTVPAPLSTTGGGTEATALRVTLATDSTGLVSVDDNAGSLTVDAPVGTPAFVRLSDGAAAISTLPVSLASVPSHAVTNAGTFATQVDGAALTALQLIDDAVSGAGFNVTQMNGVNVTMGNGASGTGVQRVTLASDSTGIVALTTSTASIGRLAANSGIDVGDVDVTSVVPGTGATNLGKAEDAVHGSGDAGVYALAVRDDSPAAHSGADGDYESIHVNAEGGVWVSPTPSASGGLTIFRSLDLDETEEEVKATAGTVYGMWVTNTATATRWIKFYNATAANVIVGTTVPVITIGIPGNTSDDIAGNFGPGGHGIAFGTAITVAATTGVADADTGAPAANDVIVNIFYK